MAFTYRMTVKGQLQGSEVVNVLYYHTTVDQDLEIIANKWITDIAPLYLLCCTQAYTGASVKVVRTDNLTMSEVDWGGDGSLVADTMPAQVTGLISWRSGIASRSGRGRTYMPAVPENQVTEGVVQAPQVTAYMNFAAAAVSYLYGDLVIYHRNSLTYLPVQSYLVRNHTYTQRRRGFARGA